MKAVVVSAINEYEVEDIVLDPPKDYEIRVEVKAAGLCHSDLSAITGSIPAPFPLVLGHEGAGVVIETGAKVSRCQVGDHVVFTLQGVCGQCKSCMHGRHIFCDQFTPDKLLGATLPDGSLRHSRTDGTPLHSYAGLGCLAEETVVHENMAVKIDSDIPMDRAAIVGCAVIAGAGGAIFGADIRSGDSVAILGCGGIGLAAIQGAGIAGASTIIAVDIAPYKLDLARKLGATHCIDGRTESTVESIHKLTAGGADTVIECAGIPALIKDGYDALRLGGTLLVIGVPPFDEMLPIECYSLPFSGKTIKGGKYGNHNPFTDIPLLLDYYRQGKLDLDSMVSRTYSIDQVHKAIGDMEKNVNARGVVVFDKGVIRG